jgi:hypothetical protein
MIAMPRHAPFKAAGKNDVWFAVFVIAAVVVVSLLAHADHTHAPERPAPVPAIEIKGQTHA